MSHPEMVWTGQYRHALRVLKFSRPEDVDRETVEREIAARTRTIQEIEREGGATAEKAAPRAAERSRLIGEVTDLGALLREKACPGQ